jgi:hypothetical protein
MENKNWREVAEIVGIVSIIAGLILVAWEVRQANNIATTQVVMDLAAQANEFNSSAFANSDVADLLTVISDPEGVDISETQKSMMASVAQHFANIFWAAQRAYDNGVLGDDDILMYQLSLEWHLENLPGLRPAYLTLYDNTPWLREMYVFQPLVELACGSKRPCGDLTAGK